MFLNIETMINSGGKKKKRKIYLTLNNYTRLTLNPSELLQKEYFQVKSATVRLHKFVWNSLNSSLQKVKEFRVDKELDADTIWVCAGEWRGTENDAECACITDSANMATLSHALFSASSYMTLS